MPHNTHNLLTELLSDLEQTRMLWQLAVLGFSLALAWGLGRLLRGRLPKSQGALKVGLGGVSRVAFPLIALLLVVIGKTVLKNWHSVNLLNIATSLLLALALVRLIVYALRRIFAPSGWLHGSERFIATAIWIGLALHLTGFLPEILDALDDLSFNVGKQKISLLTILSGILSVLVTLLAAMWLGRTLENRLMTAEKLDPKLRVVLSKLLRALLVVLGILVALPLAGIDITVLSVFGGALGIGIGFGLQKIAGNYVSGFIILLDHSIHPGDILTVEGRFGTVSLLTARYLVLHSNDGTEAIIPNETLISSTIINHSYTNRQIRIGLPVQIGYQSDLERAMEIMKEAAAKQPRALANPEPKVFLKSFGDNGIDLELDIWINDPEEGQLNLRSDINLEIWRQFQAAGIEIPYPQRDVRIIGGLPG
ncbi:MAG: mechanosensitive ion channel protein MscS [Hydrogenophilales bacterium CG_4_9_14_3_um_filter_59_35]|nr:MAG: mechanosensitive ion channel protein MscS [Hydrogenophilales bacterium CG18_big_fil_WC_8_21_14_2_50_58_12]PIX99187.1 MAG: mechanosensitive ion channel protein MscS [Hydrogenophilales bacterium CG_4_10_14_3_um_filter_58_23]PJB07626.1 MAG: mechanosensitive ion channel protein MscS [Hydrogenophilales bacterium CG_4_9_14_3_um_filter_59_35]